MKPISCILVTVAVLIGAAAAAQQPPVAPLEDDVRVTPLHKDSVSGGEREAARAVAYETWHLRPGLKTGRLPRQASATLILELAAGKMTTVIDGVERRLQVGEFVVIRAPQALTLITEDDSVIVRVLQVEESRR